MRKFLKTLALMAVAAVGAVSCSETIADDTITPSIAEGVTLYATTPINDASTKVTFEDKDSEGIVLSWEKGDTFNLYKEGDTELVATFTCSDAATGLFVSDVASLEETAYTARYNANVDDSTIAVQDGDAIANLNDACVMEATFTYGTDTSIAFEHQMAIMTFKFKSDVSPATLLFENGEQTYTVNYKSIAPDDKGIYTSHIMIAPCGDGSTSRTMTFSLLDTEGTVYYDYTVETTKAYVAGYRYTADLTATPDFGGTTELTLTTVSSADINSYANTWVITDAAWNSNSTESSAYDAFSALRTAIKAALNANRDITLVFPNMTVFPEQSIYGVNTSTGTGTLSISLPVTTTIEFGAFWDSGAVVSVSAPVAQSIGNRAFLYNVNLASFEIASSVTSIGENPFYGCLNLRLTNNSSSFKYENGLLYSSDGSSIIAGIGNDIVNGEIVLDSSVTSIGREAFYGVKTLKSITGEGVEAFGNDALTSSSIESLNLAKLSSIGSNFINYCASLTSITLPNITSIGSDTFGGCTALTNLILGSEGSSAINIGLHSTFADFIAADVAPNIDLVIRAEGLTWSDNNISISGNVMTADNLMESEHAYDFVKSLTFKSINGVSAQN